MEPAHPESPFDKDSLGVNTQDRKMIKRFLQSPVIWTGSVTMLRTFGFFLVLPLVLRKIPSENLGMWYVFLGVSQFCGFFELGFASNISRFASYFMGGAANIRSIGISATGEGESEPNLNGIAGLAEMGRVLYAKLAVTLAVLMNVGGGVWLYWHFGNKFWNPSVAPAFFLYAVGMSLSMYGYFWMNLLFGVNRVRQGEQIFAVGLVLNYLICAGGLLAGAGLYALALGQIAQAIFPRLIAYRIISNNILIKATTPINVTWRDLWPMTWRSGLCSFGSYLSLPVMTLVCAQVVGLADTASYGLSLQLAFMLHGLSATWMAVTWPRLGSMRARGDYPQIRALITRRLTLSLMTYLAGGVIAWMIAPGALHLFHSKTEFLAPIPLAILLAVVGADCFLGLCNAILLTGNHVPHMRVTIITGVAAISISFPLGHYYGILGIIVAPLCAQALMNLWHTPLLCLRDLHFINPK